MSEKNVIRETLEVLIGPTEGNLRKVADSLDDVNYKLKKVKEVSESPLFKGMAASAKEATAQAEKLAQAFRSVASVGGDLAKGAIAGIVGIPAAAAAATAAIGIGLVASFGAAVLAADDLAIELKRVREIEGFKGLSPEVNRSIQIVNGAVDGLRLGFARVVELMAGVAGPAFAEFGIQATQIMLGLIKSMEKAAQAGVTFGDVFRQVVNGFAKYVSEGIIKTIAAIPLAFAGVIGQASVAMASVSPEISRALAKTANDMRVPIDYMGETMGSVIADGIMDGAQAGLDRLAELAAASGVSRSEALKFIGAAYVPPAAPALGGAAPTTTAALSPESMAQTISLISDEARDALTEASEALADSGEKVARDLSGVADVINGAISGAASGSISGLGGAVAAVSDIPIIGWIANAIQGILEIISDPEAFVGAIKEGVFDAIISGIRNMSQLGPMLMDALMGFLQELPSAILESIPGMLSEPFVVLGSLIEGIFVKFPEALADGIKRWWESVKDWVKELFRIDSDEVGTFFKKLGNTILDISTGGASAALGINVFATDDKSGIITARTASTSRSRRMRFRRGGDTGPAVVFQGALIGRETVDDAIRQIKRRQGRGSRGGGLTWNED